MMTAPATAPNDIALLEITRVFDASPDRVFDAWMVREQWQSWIGPEGVNCEVPLLEPHVGGRYRITMHLSDGRIIPVAGTFKEIDRPTRIVFTWKWEGGEEDDDTLVSLTLRDLKGKTELTLRHQGLRTVENRDNHGKGWNGTLNKLASYLTAGGASSRA